ncbi:MAG: hypothetical protein HRT87_06515 [Legionellales bacterium]|nr:hypothetical protein [Legionellales bacterium]
MTLESILNLNIDYQQNMLNYTQSFKKYFKADYLRIYEIRNENYFLLLDNNLTNLKIYIDKKLYLNYPHLFSSKLVQKDHFIIWPSIQDQDYSDHWLTNIQKELKTNPKITIIKAKPFGYIAFCLCTNKVHEKTHGLYYNHYQYLNQCIKTLEMNIQHILKEEQNNYISLHEIKNDILDVQKSILSNTISENQKEYFLDML